MKLRIEKGLFRLWIVLSAIWICATLIKHWNDYTGTRDAYIETWDANIRDAPYKKDLSPLVEERFWQSLHDEGVYTATDFLPMSKEQCGQHKKEALANWKKACIESIPNTLASALGIPFLLMILYYILKWIVIGFVSKN